MEIRSIEEDRLIDCLGIEIGILDSDTKVACFWSLKINKFHY